MPHRGTRGPFCTRSAGILDETLRRNETSLPDQDADADRVQSGLLLDVPRLPAVSRPVGWARISGSWRGWPGRGRPPFEDGSAEGPALVWSDASLEIGIAKLT